MLSWAESLYAYRGGTIKDEAPKMAFWLLTVLAVLASIVGGTAIIAQSDPPAFLDSISSQVKRLDAELVILIAGTAVPLILALIAYLLSLRKSVKRRPTLGLYLLGFSICYIGATWAAISLGSDLFFSTLPLIGAIAAILLLSSLPRLIEIGVGKVCAAMGNGMLNKERYAGAARMLGIALRLMPTNERVACNQGMALYELGEAEQALETLVTAYRHGERDARLVRTLADSVFELPDDLAGDILADILELEPNNARFGRKLVDLHMKGNRQAEALPVLEKFYSADDLEDVCLLGRLNAEQGNIKRALDLARRAADLEGPPYKRTLADLQILAMQAPENPDVLLVLAGLNEKIGNRDEAATWYLNLLDAQDNNVEARRNLIRLYRELGRPDQATPHYRKLLRQEPDSPEVALEYGQLLEDREDFEKALKVFQDLASRHPDDYRFAHHCAISLYGLGQLTEASEALERARANAPASQRAQIQGLASRIHAARVKVELGAMREKAKRPDATTDERLDYIKRLLDYDEADDAVGELDILLEQKPGEKAKIVQFIEKMVGDGQAHFVLLNMLAGIRLKEHRFDECHSLYEKMAKQSLHPEEIMAEGCRQILRHKPDHLPALKSHGDLLMRGGHFREAARVLGRILELSPPAREEMLPMLFEVYYQLGDADRAVPYGEELLKRDSKNLNLFLRLRELMVRRDDHSAAIRIIRRALEFAPDNRQLKEMLKESQQRLKEGRIDRLKAQLETSPEDPVLLHELADYHIEFGQINEAITAFQKASQSAEGNLRNLCLIKLAHSLATKQMFDLADETHDEINVDKKEPEHLEEIKRYMYDVGGLFEEDEQFGRALKIFKTLFKIDAGYRDIVDKIELLSHLAR